MNHESANESKLQRVKNKTVKLDWRAEAMKLMGRRRGDETPTKKDQSLLTSSPTLDLYYNDFLTLSGISAEVFDYKLGNRSAPRRAPSLSRRAKAGDGGLHRVIKVTA